MEVDKKRTTVGHQITVKILLPTSFVPIKQKIFFQNEYIISEISSGICKHESVNIQASRYVNNFITK